MNCTVRARAQRLTPRLCPFAPKSFAMPSQLHHPHELSRCRIRTAWDFATRIALCTPMPCPPAKWQGQTKAYWLIGLLAQKTLPMRPCCQHLQPVIEVSHMVYAAELRIQAADEKL